MAPVSTAADSLERPGIVQTQDLLMNRPSLALKKQKQCVIDTMPDTHLLKKVIQAETLGRIDSLVSYPFPTWPIYPESCQRFNTKEHNRNQICVDQL